MIPVEYNPEAKCPEFDRFIETAMCWDGWDGSTHLEMLAYMFRVMGYAITGLTAERCFFIFHGEGRNGKSVLLSLLEAILGRGVLAGRIKSESLLATGQRSGSSHDTDIADIEGMRVILASEIPDGSVLNEGLVKALTGNEVIKTRQLNQKGRLIKPQGKLFLAVNHLPRIGGQDEGIWDRIHRIPWNVRVVKPDLLLTDRLIKNELAGILNTCVMGFQNYLQEGGLKPPAVVLEANKQYRDDEDIVGRFLADCCQLGEDLECTNTELYGAYNTWAKGSGYRPVAENRLGRMFSERGFTRTHSKSQRGWRGLSVTASVQAGEDAPAWLEPERQLRMIGG
jgi:putative DNA primase/helicase